MVETRLALTFALLVGAGNAAILSTLPAENVVHTATTTSSARTSSTTSSTTDVEDPNTVLDGLYSECVLSFSFPCIQRKTLLFIERLGRSTVYPLIGNFITLVRTKPLDEPQLAEDKLRYLKGDQLADMVDTAVTDFFQNHVFRMQLPNWMIDSSSERRSDNALDFYVGDSEVEEGRKKIGGGGGGKKGMKKMMMMMCMMVAGKAMMIGPILLGLTKLAAIKALILSFVSLTISKIMILKKLQKQKASGGGGGGWSSGGGGGGGWSSGGGSSGGGGWQSSGGGWDRSLSNHDLAYNGYLAHS
ncbi:hypothetical protein O3M35_012080 [Rhynocoris fuscipes]|uniref:Uncharacterized protein n=1 Tax=Rhynocoris fuscipes TaxID=488301 RepID=A0AAW1CUM7_9HEMI